MDHVLDCSGYEIAKTDIVRAEGAYLFDAGGRRYVDFESGVWCTALGHNHPAVRDAIRAQLERVSHLGYRVESSLAEDAAVAVLDTLPFPDGKCVFLASGSEAVELAVQITRRLTGKPLLLSLADSYLAAYGSAARRDLSEWHLFDWRECAGCPRAAGCSAECIRLRAVPFDRIGGFAFEPGNAGGTVRLPPRGLVRRLAGSVAEHGGLIVVDEVTTGLGRTGLWYGYQHYDLAPDLVALGKGLGNGYPVSCVAMTRAIGARLEKDRFHYAQSHQDDPLGCVIARTVIETLRCEGLIERGARTGDVLRDGLQTIARTHDTVREVRGRGLMAVVEIEETGRTDPVTPLFRKLLDRGFLVGCKPAASLLRFYPPLGISNDDVGGLLTAFDEVLGEEP
ncbi:MAG: aspartate aminotransferase family protein [Candidatus Bipolaricaulis sp.]|nr:aspartate aminotransferase family protein [Candidatus Bipolaricaulis sp.]MDD5220496.1 aspartate aminotransferase family protein [Candidatus Bipolaricaulis sp.]